MEEDKENGFTLALIHTKIEVQNQIMTLMQTQIDMQNEKITKQEVQIDKLTGEVEELKQQISELTSSKDARAEKEKSEVDSNQNESSMSIAEMARQTAEETLASSGFVYDENSGLYYDYSSGFYYDSTRKLYYNGHTRTYYSFNESTKKYIFHSQLPSEEKLPKESTLKKGKKKLKNKSTQATFVEKKSTGVNDLEDGELSSSSGESENSVRIIEQHASDSDTSHETVVLQSDDDENVGRNIGGNAPCIRAIVMESTVPQLKKGFLFMVTCMGGTIGREGSHHAILIPDDNVSKEHAKITYDFEEVAIDDPNDENKSPLEKKYFIADLGSQNGTYLNGKRLSQNCVKSEPVEIIHGSILQILDTKVLIHIHDGLLTCGHCEPGLLIEKEVIRSGPVLSQTQKEASRKKAIRKIRQKYAIGPSQANSIPQLMEKYKDRAQDRRHLQGSDHHSFKIPTSEPASMHIPINQENKGFKMLTKMGWSEGESLGHANTGVREPVKFEVKMGRSGLGARSSGLDSDAPPPPSRFLNKAKSRILQKTLQRYNITSEKGNKPSTDVLGHSHSRTSEKGNKPPTVDNNMGHPNNLGRSKKLDSLDVIEID